MEPYKKLSRSVKGRVVLITGAASGMGRATAHLFAQEGASVAATDINEAGLRLVIDEIKAAGGSSRAGASTYLMRTASSASLPKWLIDSAVSI